MLKILLILWHGLVMSIYLNGRKITKKEKQIVMMGVIMQVLTLIYILGR